MLLLSYLILRMQFLVLKERRVDLEDNKLKCLQVNRELVYKEKKENKDFVR